tara:strand:- start:15 stop:467 length:453 start_codon:yes stop_codon:yes gene_type:complete
MPDKNLYDTTFKVPDKCVDHIKNAVSQFNGPETTEGYERANNIIKNPHISLSLLKKINNFFRNEEEGSQPYNLTGGDYGKKVFQYMEDQTRNSRASSRKNKKRGGMLNTHYKEHEKDGNTNPTGVSVPEVDKVNTLIEQIKQIKKLINYL